MTLTSTVRSARTKVDRRCGSEPWAFAGAWIKASPWGLYGVCMGSEDPGSPRYNEITQSPQSFVLCSDFVESEQTRVNAEIGLGALVMKGSVGKGRRFESVRGLLQNPADSPDFARSGPHLGSGPRVL